MRLINDNYEGVITNLLPDNQVEIEVEDGFRIPVLKNEVVVIQAEEAEFFGDAASRPKPKPQPIVQPSKHERIVTKNGTYIAFTPFNDQELSLYLINYTDSLLLYSFGTGTGSQYKGLRADILSKNKAVRLLQLPIKDLKSWAPLVFQLIWHDHQELHQPVQRIFQQFSPKTFFKDRKTAPVIGQEATIFSLTEAQPPKPSAPPRPEVLRETLLENATREVRAETQADVPEVIDLHIEQLTDDHEAMSNSEMIALQINTFEKYLDQAIVCNKAHITFIHGVGKGKLRMEIQRRLSGHPSIDYYKDAQRNKFGRYGATFVQLK